MPQFQNCRDDIADLLTAGQIDAAAQRALLAIDAETPKSATMTSAFHFVGLAVRYATQGDNTAAREAMDHALDIATGSSDQDDLRPQLYRHVAASLEVAGQPASAARCLETGIEYGADGPAVWQALGRARLKSDDPYGALEALSHSQRLKPSAEVVSDRILAELAVDPSPGTARQSLSRLESSRPEQVSVRWDFALGRAHEVSGNTDAARAAYQRVLEHVDEDLGPKELEHAKGFIST